MARSALKNIIIKYTILCLVVAGVAGRFFWQRNQWLDHVGSYAAYPFLRAQQAVTSFFDQRAWRKKRIDELEQQLYEVACQNDVLEAELLQVRALIDFAHDTAELRKFADRYTMGQSVLAQVLFKQFEDDTHYLLIDVGSAQGVTEESIVVHKNCLIGRVDKVYPWYSRVIPITDKSCKVGVYCGRTKATGIYEGMNVLDKATVQHVSHLVTVKDGDMVITSGKGLLFPRGFLVGKVVAHTKGSLYHEIEVAPALDIADVDYCYVISRATV